MSWNDSMQVAYIVCKTNTNINATMSMKNWNVALAGSSIRDCKYIGIDDFYDAITDYSIMYAYFKLLLFINSNSIFDS